MILCIESWKGDTLLSGKSASMGKLKQQIRTAEAICDPAEDNFIPLLCRIYGWEPIAFSEELVPDRTYDRDTGLLLRISP